MSEADKIKEFGIKSVPAVYHMTTEDHLYSLAKRLETEIAVLKSRSPTLTDAQVEAVKSALSDLESMPRSLGYSFTSGNKLRAAFAGLLEGK